MFEISKMMVPTIMPGIKGKSSLQIKMPLIITWLPPINLIILKQKKIFDSRVFSIESTENKQN